MATVTKRDKRPDRGPNGQFLPGNPGGPGNPFAARVGELRAALLNAVTPGDYAAMIARPGGADPDALAALKAKLDARLKMLDDERDGGGEAQ